MQDYIFWQMMKGVADYKDDVDMILEKAKFEAGSDEYHQKLNQQRPKN